ncbi:protein CELLULOSE SYNTHASE INTERACTIVE 3-like [Andrographis paniculata]|uniref:protein CELLULOSE SYNTHASE INTERACTIVE 3-like n=1 Tax=Andrographis paniculata TaxID=175694 RepID=UPI0021E8304B|nr:protein CELLULOSE SYNTHASE INTERACTIVE 3-like [Andrographis paniculata]XP_051140159.1 protein CELLULOSE SYNTHASE INTERACTIVE 3-like [Andrographis paniculata]
MDSAAIRLPPQPSSSEPSASGALEEVVEVLNRLIPSTVSINSFGSRWQVLRVKLASLKSIVGEIADSAPRSENPLLQPLLSALTSTLLRVEILCRQCSDASFSRGKLLMQSDLDMAAGWLSKQINDLELLIRSGVLSQSTAIVPSRPNGNSSTEELTFFVKDLFARLQIGGLEFKRKALDSLIQILSEDLSSAVIVAKEGNLNCLISLLDSNSHDSIRELVVHALSLLVSAGDLPRKCVFEEGALGPLLRTIDCSSILMKEKAAMAVEFITSQSDHAWAISAYGGVPILVELCKSGTPTAQSHAIGSIRNISIVEDIQIALAEEGAIPVLMQLLVSGNASAQLKSANCISILASSGEHFRDLFLKEQCLSKLLHLFHECPTANTLEHVLRAIYSLSTSDATCRYLCESTMFVARIAELIQYGKLIRLQHIAASLLAKLPVNDSGKTPISISGCISSLLKLMETVKPNGIQEVAAKALVTVLSVKSNRKAFVRDDECLSRLVKMLDPENEVVSKKFPVAIVAAVMARGSQACRKKLVAAGVCGHLKRLGEMDVPGAKKALQRLSANRLITILSMSWKE